MFEIIFTIMLAHGPMTFFADYTTSAQCERVESILHKTDTVLDETSCYRIKEERT